MSPVAGGSPGIDSDGDGFRGGGRGAGIERLARPLHGTEAPSDWVRRWSPLVRPGGRVLDIACGHGRHARWFSALGHPVTALDRDPAAVAATLQAVPACEAVMADIENAPWPLAGRRFDAVVVTHYLWRPLFAAMAASLAPGGVLIYETFTRGQETIGKPSRSDFLLQTSELLQVFSAGLGLRVVGFEDGFEALPAPWGAGAAGGRFVQRIAAVLETDENPSTAAGTSAFSPGPPRYRLP